MVDWCNLFLASNIDTDKKYLKRNKKNDRVNKETITNLSDIANTSSNCSANVAIDNQSSVRFTKKEYFDCLLPLHIESLFMILYGSAKVSHILSSMNLGKSDGPNSNPRSC